MPRKYRTRTEVWLYSFFNLDARWWSTPIRPLYAANAPVHFVQETVWAPGPVWTRAENLSYTGIQSPNRPTGSSSICQLRHPAAPSARPCILRVNPSASLHMQIRNCQPHCHNVQNEYYYLHPTILRAASHN